MSHACAVGSLRASTEPAVSTVSDQTVLVLTSVPTFLFIFFNCFFLFLQLPYHFYINFILFFKCRTLFISDYFLVLLSPPVLHPSLSLHRSCLLPSLQSLSPLFFLILFTVICESTLLFIQFPSFILSFHLRLLHLNLYVILM